MHSTTNKNWFDDGGQAYADFRPHYPPALAAYLAQLAPSRCCAVDVGCGSGQLTHALADHFDQVVGIDPSASQLASATARANIHYAVGAAERLPVADASASLITAAQAAHWFDLPAFYTQVRRIAQPGAVLALVSYGVMTIEGAPAARFAQFYHHDIGPYWPAARTLVDSGYAGIPFPFDECAAPVLSIENAWTLDQVLGYISTWSALKRARAAGQHVVLDAFARDLAAVWGEPQQRRAVSWPITMRVGRVDAG